MISSQFQGTTKITCKSKYIKHFVINPDYIDSYHEWTELEEELLLECVELYGKDWNIIQQRCFSWVPKMKLKNKHYAITKLKNKPE